MKRKHPVRWLLLIVLGLALLVAIPAAGFVMEGNQAAQTLAENPDIHGHPSGYSAIFSVPLAVLAFLLCSVIAVVKMILAVRYNRRLTEMAEADKSRHFSEAGKKPYDPEMP